jgi:hypothetical protein
MLPGASLFPIERRQWLSFSNLIHGRPMRPSLWSTRPHSQARALPRPQVVVSTLPKKKVVVGTFPSESAAVWSLTGIFIVRELTKFNMFGRAGTCRNKRHLQTVATRNRDDLIGDANVTQFRLAAEQPGQRAEKPKVVAIYGTLSKPKLESMCIIKQVQVFRTRTRNLQVGLQPEIEVREVTERPQGAQRGAPAQLLLALPQPPS